MNSVTIGCRTNSKIASVSKQSSRAIRLQSNTCFKGAASVPDSLQVRTRFSFTRPMMSGTAEEHGPKSADERNVPSILRFMNATSAFSRGVASS